MLEGKPKRVDDAVTMRAIKDILSDPKSDLAGPISDPSTTSKPTRAQASAANLTLTPVREVDVKVRPAAFTTVPSGAAPDTDVEIIRTEVPLVDNAAQQEATAPVSTSEPKPKRPRRRKAALPKLVRSIALPKPSPRWVAIAVLVACAVLYPALIIAPVFGTLVLVIGMFAVFGAERVWDGVGHALARYEARAPRKAARLKTRLDALAVRWDAVLDRFPDGWVDGLYLPDFANRAERTRREDAKVNARLQRMHGQV